MTFFHPRLSEDLIDQGHIPYGIGRALGPVGPWHANVPQASFRHRFLVAV